MFSRILDLNRSVIALLFNINSRLHIQIKSGERWRVCNFFFFSTQSCTLQQCELLLSGVAYHFQGQAFAVVISVRSLTKEGHLHASDIVRRLSQDKLECIYLRAETASPTPGLTSGTNQKFESYRRLQCWDSEGIELPVINLDGDTWSKITLNRGSKNRSLKGKITNYRQYPDTYPKFGKISTSTCPMW